MNPSRHIAAMIAGLAGLVAASAVYAGEVLDRISTSRVLTVATAANWAPQSFLNDQNQMDGFDVDVAKEIGKRLGAEVKFVTPAWDVITAGKWSGRWDISVGSMTPTAKRAEVLSFPAIYYYTPAAVAVHSNSAAAKPSDLDGKVVGACTNCTYELYLKHDLTIDAKDVPAFEYQIKPAEIKSYQGPQPIFDDLRLGDGTRLDGMVEGLPAILAAIKSGYPIKVVGEPIYYEPLALAIDRGDQEFNDKLAQIIADMKADGSMTALSMKWYGVDYTKAN